MPDPTSRRIPWPRIFAEGVVIVVSILLALYADRWNSDRLDRAEEREVIARLISDLERDVRAFANGLNTLAGKEQSLMRVESILNSVDPTPDETADFLRDVILGTGYGWNQQVARRITFDELLGSGTFGLIRNPLLREAISDYYNLDAVAQSRIGERETEYPYVSYRLVPRQK